MKSFEQFLSKPIVSGNSTIARVLIDYLGLGLLAAQEGAKEIQKSKAQEATKLVKEKVDQKKKRKAKRVQEKEKESALHNRRDQN